MGHSWETLIELSHAVFEKNTLSGLDYIYIWTICISGWLYQSDSHPHARIMQVMSHVYNIEIQDSLSSEPYICSFITPILARASHHGRVCVRISPIQIAADQGILYYYYLYKNIYN